MPSATGAERRLSGTQRGNLTQAAEHRGALPRVSSSVSCPKLSGLSRAKVLDVIFQPESIQQDGSIGIETGRRILTLQPTSGEPVARMLRHLSIWKLQSDGSWLIQADASIIQVPNPPPF